MSLASVVLQPQRFQRPQVDITTQLIDDVLKTVSLLVEDAVDDGLLAKAILDAGLAVVPSIEQQLAQRLTQAQEKLRLRVQPLLEGFDRLATDVTAIGDDPSRAVALARQLLDLGSAFLDGLTYEGVRSAVQTAVDVLEKDLGLSAEFAKAQLIAFLSEAANQVVAKTQADVALRRKGAAIASVIRRLGSFLNGVTDLPRLQVDGVARLLYQWINGLGLKEVVSQARCAIGEFETSIEAAGALGAALPRLAEGGGSVGAALVQLPNSATYAWYPSWLLASEDLPLIGVCDVKDRVRLVTRIRDVVDSSVFMFLRRELPQSLQAEFVTVSSTSPPSDDLLLRLLASLNELIQGPLIFDRDLFATFAVSEDFRKEQESAIAKQCVLLANRRLFEKALANELDSVSGGFCRWLGRNVLGVIDWPRNYVYVTGDKRFVMCGDMPLKFGENLKWNDAPLFSSQHPGQTFWIFKKTPADVCEHIAHHTHWVTSLGVAIWRLVNIVLDQPGHRIGSSIAISLDFVETVSQLLFGRPIHGFDSLGGFGRWLSSSVVGPRGLARFGGAFQGLHTVATAGNGFLFWLTVFLGDVIRTSSPSGLLGPLVRDIPLSVITLINFGGPRSGGGHSTVNPAQNLFAQGPIDSIVNNLFGLALMAIYRREDHSIEIWSAGGIGDRRLRAFLLWFFGAGVFGAFAGTSTILLSMLCAWPKDKPDAGKIIGLNCLFMFLKYWFLEYFIKEGDTDDGTYNPRGPSKFKGYPKKDTSPYKLPFKKGEGLYCGQGNQGLWSHNDITNIGSTQQCYAYDFGHDHEQDIHAARGGVVWDFDESIENNDTSDWNFITILHDVVESEHDDPFDKKIPVTTFAVYGHGAKNGVTNAFAKRGITSIVKEKSTRGSGTRVNQGDIIMLADDTGISFHSHLHMHVVMDKSGVVVPASGTPDPDNVGIPFVFREVRGDGRPKNLTWYESDNG